MLNDSSIFSSVLETSGGGRKPSPWDNQKPQQPEAPTKSDAASPWRPAPSSPDQRGDAPWRSAPRPAPPLERPRQPKDDPLNPIPTGDSPNLPSRSGAGRSSEALVNAFNRDKVTRSEYSFYEAVEKGIQLGKENETALELHMRDWLGKQSTANPLSFMRGTAILAAALGEFRLEEGSRIDLSSHADKKPRILKGYDYDFGGEANTWLRMSAGSLVEAQQYVRGHKDLIIEGQAMDDAYLGQLKNLQSKIEKSLDNIYGPHDIDSIYEVIKTELRSNSGDWQKGLVRLKYQLDTLKTNDSRFLAKSARDVALGFYAEADYMSTRDNGEEARIMYQAADQYLAMSKRFDGAAPDNIALQEISSKLKERIQKSIDNQWSDPFNNPLEIPKTNPLLV
ncbi:MAG: hypothetical protein K2X27_17415 [Candidatus Obscuribacterales bacterium]|nr:hypothetical protein [Candidatus Obscuribacterales bacterium]